MKAGTITGIEGDRIRIDNKNKPKPGFIVKDRNEKKVVNNQKKDFQKFKLVIDGKERAKVEKLSYTDLDKNTILNGLRERMD